MLKRKIATFILAALLFTQALAALTTRSSTANETPDSGQGGTSAVTGNTNTGHGSTTSSVVDVNSQNKTCRWSGFAAAPYGHIVSVTLKVDYTSDGSFTATGLNAFVLDYSLNNGSNWTNGVNRTQFNSPTTTTFSVTLPNNQNLTQVQVRDSIQADGQNPGDTAASTATVSNIRIEVVTQDGTVVVVMED